VRSDPTSFSSRNVELSFDEARHKPSSERAPWRGSPGVICTSARIAACSRSGMAVSGAAGRSGQTESSKGSFILLSPLCLWSIVLHSISVHARSRSPESFCQAEDRGRRFACIRLYPQRCCRSPSSSLNSWCAAKARGDSSPLHPYHLDVPIDLARTHRFFVSTPSELQPSLVKYVRSPSRAGESIPARSRETSLLLRREWA
jgi:hypothetical protein